MYTYIYMWLLKYLQKQIRNMNFEYLLVAMKRHNILCTSFNIATKFKKISYCGNTKLIY